jgi:hypothetical protein
MLGMELEDMELNNGTMREKMNGPSDYNCVIDTR